MAVSVLTATDHRRAEVRTPSTHPQELAQARRASDAAFRAALSGWGSPADLAEALKAEYRLAGMVR